MINWKKLGSLFICLGIIAYGVQQLVIRDFRPEIVPEFPAWAHEQTWFPLLTGIAMIVAALLIAYPKVRQPLRLALCFGLGVYFLLLIVAFHLPYRLFISPNKIYHLGVWAQALKELAFAGAVFIWAASFSPAGRPRTRRWIPSGHALMLMGRICFATTMVLFGYSHFVYTSFIAPLVPDWLGAPVFWTCFGGAALIGLGLCIMLGIQISRAALLLALMLFSWLILIHIPGAWAHPYRGRGNSIVSAFDALLFCGAALIVFDVYRRRAFAKEHEPVPLP